MKVEMIWILSAVYLLLNFLVTIIVFKRDDLETFQKVAQAIIIWLIPFAAAIGIWLFYWSSDKNNVRVHSFAKNTAGDSAVSSNITGSGAAE
ncbi:hypothetical protein V1358_00505 [Pseudoalteromonas sp. YIC-656]|uniref:hypothetical protein n=1 Tax=Pseudoalteromonas pernae TaxID=3118054 RepID=UPI003241F92D